MPASKLEDVAWLQEFIQRSADVLPLPEKTTKKSKRTESGE